MQIDEITNFRSKATDLALLQKGMAQLPRALREMGFDSMREGQDRGIISIMGGQDTLCVFPTALGKCLGKDTPVLMFDGTVKMAQDVKAGDRLLGPDGAAREVVSTCQGQDTLYTVSPLRGGDPYVVNSQHVLSFQLTPGGRKGDRIRVNGKFQKGGDVVNLEVGDYLRASRTVKHRLKGWRSGPIEFGKEENLPDNLPPYLLGIWLGDGSLHNTGISKPDPEIESYLREHAAKIGAHIYDGSGSGSCPTWRTVFPDLSNGRKGGSNSFLNVLRDVGVLHRKHIPDAYQRASLRSRLELLAGLVDTDGDLCEGGRAYSITSKDKDLITGTAFVARSCGFYASIAEKSVKLEGWDAPRVYHRVYFSGNVSSIPCKIERKKALEGGSSCAVSRYAVRVESSGHGEYFGFELSGPDRLFLLGDFTVTHNSAVFVVPTLCHGWRTLIFSPLKALMRDQVQGLQNKGICALALSSDQTEIENTRSISDWIRGECRILYVAPERLRNEAFMRALRQSPPDFVAVDEVHCLSAWSDNFRHSYMYIGDMIEQYNPRVVAGFTATMPETVEADVRRVLRMPDAVKIFHFPQRKNLLLSSSSIDLYNDLPQKVRDINGKTLVYCGSQEKTVQTAQTLGRYLGEEVGFYHADIKESVKKMYQDAFQKGSIRVMCATNAFGMGIDVPDIRGVVHLMHPGDPEALSQETGRAGRDGLESICHTYESRDAMRMQEMFIDTGHPAKEFYERVFRFLNQQADPAGNFHSSYKEIEAGSKVGMRYLTSIFETFHGARVLESLKDEPRVSKVRLLRESDLGRFIQMECELEKISSRDGDWMLFDLDCLAQAMKVGPPTVKKYLNTWKAENLLEYEPPPPGTAKKIVGGMELVDFDRLKVKRDMAYKKLAYVKGYFSVPDEEKHNYLHRYFTTM